MKNQSPVHKKTTSRFVKIVKSSSNISIFWRLFFVASHLCFLSSLALGQTQQAPAAPSAGVIINDGNGTVILPSDIFPADNVPSGGVNPSGMFPDVSINPGGTAMNGGNISEAVVPDEFSCPLFQNESTKDLLLAIDSLSSAMAAMQTFDECKNSSMSAAEVESTATGLKDAIKSVNGMMVTPTAGEVGGVTAGTTANLGEVEKQMNTIVGSIKKMGDSLKNNSLLNPMCSKKTGAWKVFSSFNDIVLNLAPLFLFGVSMNPALAPLLPMVVGGTVVSGGVSVVDKMIAETDLYGLNKIENRKAFVKNLCQYLKVLRKYHLMQEARSGKVQKILQQIDLNVILYKNALVQKRQNLSSILNFRSAEKSKFGEAEVENKSNLLNINQLESNIERMKSTFFTCSLGASLAQEVNSSHFPQSVFVNYRKTIAAIKSNQQKEADFQQSILILRSLEQTDAALRSRIISISKKKAETPNLEECAKATQSWLGVLREVASQTKHLIDSRNAALEAKFMTNFSYKSYQQTSENLTKGAALAEQIKQVVKMAQYDWQAVEDSSMALQMRQLKMVFFGSSRRGLSAAICNLICSNSPVYNWLDSTFEEYQNTMARFEVYMAALRDGSFQQQIIDLKKHPVTPKKPQRIFLAVEIQKQITERLNLANFDLKHLPKGELMHQNVCKNLAGAWYTMDEARVHLAATQYLCRMISPVLDRVDIDQRITDFCMDEISPNGVLKHSKINRELLDLKKSEINKTALTVKARMDELDCPISL